ncbi:hypothetical protein TMatcc_000168 [Talaromyces marneffei ATCC 18224]
MREVRSRTDNENGVAIDQSSNRRNVNFIVRCWAWYLVNFDTKVVTSLEEGGMHSFGDNPAKVQ